LCKEIAGNFMAPARSRSYYADMNSESNWQIDPGAEAHDPELYAEIGIAEAIDGLERLDAAALARYRAEGFLAVENALTPEEVEAAKRDIDDLVMGRREGFKGIVYEKQAADNLPTLSLDDRLDAVRKFWAFVDFAPHLHKLAVGPKLMGAVERLLGATPQLFQDMALIKPPKIGREKPWHQDHAYFDLPLGTRVVGVWIALDEATPENGCMRVLPGRQKAGPVVHFQRRDWQICDAEMQGEKPIAVPLRPGGLMFFDSLLPHGTPANFSPRRRRALQFHYAPAAAVKIATAERLAVFGSEGKNVTC